MLTLCQFTELGDAADFHPFNNEDVSGGVKIRAVRGNKLARCEGIARFIADTFVAGSRAKVGDEFVLAVKQGDASIQIRNDHDLAVGVKVAGRLHFIGHKAEVLAIERKILKTAVAAVGHHQNGCSSTGIHHETMRAIRLAGSVAASAKAADVFRVAVILVNKTFAVTIGHVEIAVGRDGDVGGIKFFRLGIAVALLGRPFAPELASIKRGLGKKVAFRIAEIEKFLFALAAQMEAMRAALVGLAPRADEFAVGIENNHGIVNRGVFADGVLDVDVALGVHRHAVSIAVGVTSGQCAPIVNDFVLMLATTDDRQAGASFILGEDVWCGDESGGGEASALKKTTTGDGFGSHSAVNGGEARRIFGRCKLL